MQTSLHSVDSWADDLGLINEKHDESFLNDQKWLSKYKSLFICLSRFSNDMSSNIIEGSSEGSYS